MKKLSHNPNNLEKNKSLSCGSAFYGRRRWTFFLPAPLIFLNAKFYLIKGSCSTCMLSDVAWESLKNLAGLHHLLDSSFQWNTVSVCFVCFFWVFFVGFFRDHCIDFDRIWLRVFTCNICVWSCPTATTNVNSISCYFVFIIYIFFLLSFFLFIKVFFKIYVDLAELLARILEWFLDSVIEKNLNGRWVAEPSSLNKMLLRNCHRNAPLDAVMRFSFSCCHFRGSVENLVIKK